MLDGQKFPESGLLIHSVLFCLCELSIKLTHVRENTFWHIQIIFTDNLFELFLVMHEILNVKLIDQKHSLLGFE